MFDLYKGKLSYTLSLIGLVWAAYGYFFYGLDSVVALEIVWASLAVFGVRRAMK